MLRLKPDARVVDRDRDLVAAALVLVYITLGGLTSAIYNEVLQFFVIVASLLPLTLVALHAVGGISGLERRVNAFTPLGNAGLHAWRGLGIHDVTNPLASDWVGRTPLIGAYPKIFLPFIIIIPGLIAVLTVHGLGVGVAANVTSFNTVVTYDLIQAYFAKERDPAYYLRAGRIVTVVGILISVFTAFIAKGYSNIMNYIQTLFSIFNAPLFATFIIAMFWRRATAIGGFVSLVAGTVAAYAVNRRAVHQAQDRRGAARPRLGPHPQGGARGQRGSARQAVVALAGPARRRGHRHPRRAQHHLRLGGLSVRHARAALRRSGRAHG